MESNIINAKIIKALFEKQKIKWEFLFDVKWSVVWPDTFWNYVLMFWNKKFLLDKNLNILSPTEFISIIPFDDRCYIWNLWWKCVFFDLKSKDIIEIIEHEDKYQAKIYWENKLSKYEYYIKLCNEARIIWKNEKDNKLKLLFKSFLIKFLEEIKNDNKWDSKKLNEEISKFWEACEKYIWYMIWAYKYMYEWIITKYLAWKSSTERNNLKNSKELKKKFPNIYLAMNELDDIENVIINEKWNVQWYLKKIDWKYNYINESWNLVLIYDDFKWPDKNGNIITKKDEKYYFLNWNFEYPFFWFDEIEWADNNLNYIWKFNDKNCLIIWKEWRIFSTNKESKLNKKWEPDIKYECFKTIEWPDKNGNYIIKTIWWFDSYLVNLNWEIISKPYFKIELDDKKWIYNVLSIQWKCKLDKNWKIIK